MIGSRFLDDEADASDLVPRSVSDIDHNQITGAAWSPNHQDLLEEIMEASEFNLNLKPKAIKQMHPAFATIDSKTFRRMRNLISAKNLESKTVCILVKLFY